MSDESLPPIQRDLFGAKVASSSNIGMNDDIISPQTGISMSSSPFQAIPPSQNPVIPGGGFVTARFKPVEISSAALANAQRLLAEIDAEALDSSDESQGLQSFKASKISSSQLRGLDRSTKPFVTPFARVPTSIGGVLPPYGSRSASTSSIPHSQTAILPADSHVRSVSNPSQFSRPPFLQSPSTPIPAPRSQVQPPIRVPAQAQNTFSSPSMVRNSNVFSTPVPSKRLVTSTPLARGAGGGRKPNGVVKFQTPFKKGFGPDRQPPLTSSTLSTSKGIDVAGPSTVANEKLSFGSDGLLILPDYSTVNDPKGKGREVDRQLIQRPENKLDNACFDLRESS
jgi:hypothetical protein